MDPVYYYTSMLGVTVLSFVLTYAFLRYLKNKERVRRAVAPSVPLLSKKWVMIVFLMLVGAQLALNFFAWTAALTNLNALTLFDAGAVLVTFGVVVHLYRYSQSLPF